MGRWTQKHRDTLTLEERRLKGLDLIRSGVYPAEVARRLAVTPQAVNGWIRAYEKGGACALRAQPRGGRHPFVPRERVDELRNILARGALSYGFETDLWTLPRMAMVLEKEWGVRYSRSGVWLLLKNHGFSWQRPQRQAREKDLVKVARWKRYTWPRLKKKPANGEQ